MKTSQVWLIYFMALMSVFQGYYTLTVYKAYGLTESALKDDTFLSTVGSIAGFMSSLRFVLSGAMDLKIGSFKRVYGVILITQITLGATI